METHVGSKIEALRALRGIKTQQHLSDEIGLDKKGKPIVSQQIISYLEKKDQDTCRKMQVIADALGVDLRHLIDTDVSVKEMTSKLDTPSEKPAIINLQGEPTNDDEVTISQYHDKGGSMGSGVLLRDQPGQITKWSVNQEWATKNIPANSGVDNLCIVTGFGDSMRGMFNSGDPLLVDIAIKTVEFDSVYFFRVKDEGFIKRLQRIPGEGIRVLSENKSYDPWAITPDMDFEVFGRVLKVWKSEEF